MAGKRIYIGGNIYRAGNIGDDAVLLGILKILRHAAPHARLTVGTGNGQPIPGLDDPIDTINAGHGPDVLAAVRKSDTVLIGGGTMIGDELGFAYPIGYNARIVSCAKLWGKRVGMVAVGVNDPASNGAKATAAMILKLCDLVTVRDDESQQVCNTLGVAPDRVTVTADPAFLLEPVQTPRTTALKKRLRADGPVFGVNVVNESWMGVDAYKKAIAHCCRYVQQAYHCRPVFFCNEVRPGLAYDSEANRRTAGMIGTQCELLDPIYYTPGEMIDILSTFRFVLGMRMHALIFAALARTPFLAVSRVDKVDNFMRLFDIQSSGSVADCQADRLIADVDRVFAERETITATIAEHTLALADRAADTARHLNALLTRRKLTWRRASPASLGFAARALWPHGLRAAFGKPTLATSAGPQR